MSLKKYAKGWESISYKKGDRVKEIFSVDGSIYVVDEAHSQIVRTQCGRKIMRHGIRPVGYYDEWIKWSMSVKTL